MQNRESFISASLSNFQKYLQVRTSSAKKLPDKKGVYPFITISRETGAGGHSLAAAILRQMAKETDPLFANWNMLDQNICEEIFRDPKLSAPVGAVLSESFQNEVNDYLAQMVVGSSSQLAIYGKIFRVIRMMSAEGKIIVVGRAGAFVTRELPLGVHVRLVAPGEQRVRAMMEQFNLSREKAAEEVTQQDQSRARLVRTYFNRDVANPLEYDVVFNSGRMPIETIASLVLDLVKRKTVRKCTYRDIVYSLL